VSRPRCGSRSVQREKVGLRERNRKPRWNWYKNALNYRNEEKFSKIKIEGIAGWFRTLSI